MTLLSSCVTGCLLAALILGGTTLGVKDKNLDIEASQPVEGMTKEMSAFDDQYSGCGQEMLQRVTEPGGLLETELRDNPELRRAWEEGRKCNKSIPGGRWEHGMALAAYTSDYTFHDRFNDAVKTLATNQSIYESHFLFKSLHFLLTDVVRLLGGRQQKCQDVDSGSHNNLTATKVGQMVRLGHFAWGAPSLSRPPCNTLFNIRTCHAALVHQYSCRGNVYLLIPPSELFAVEVVKPRPWERVYIALGSAGTYTRYECLHFQRSTPGDVTSSWPVKITVIVVPLVLLVILVVSLSVYLHLRKPRCLFKDLDSTTDTSEVSSTEHAHNQIAHVPKC